MQRVVADEVDVSRVAVGKGLAVVRDAADILRAACGGGCREVSCAVTARQARVQGGRATIFGAVHATHQQPLVPLRLPVVRRQDGRVVHDHALVERQCRPPKAFPLDVRVKPRCADHGGLVSRRLELLYEAVGGAMGDALDVRVTADRRNLVALQGSHKRGIHRCARTCLDRPVDHVPVVYREPPHVRRGTDKQNNE